MCVFACVETPTHAFYSNVRSVYSKAYDFLDVSSQSGYLFLGEQRDRKKPLLASVQTSDITQTSYIRYTCIWFVHNSLSGRFGYALYIQTLDKTISVVGSEEEKEEEEWANEIDGHNANKQSTQWAMGPTESDKCYKLSINSTLYRTWRKITNHESKWMGKKAPFSLSLLCVYT